MPGLPGQILVTFILVALAFLMVGPTWIALVNLVVAALRLGRWARDLPGRLPGLPRRNRDPRP